MALLHTGYIHQAQIATAIEELAASLAPDVVRINYKIDDDWTGDPALFFQIVLSDHASDFSRLSAVSQRISSTITDRIDPEQYGLGYYFAFRSASEQAEMKEPGW